MFVWRALISVYVMGYPRTDYDNPKKLLSLLGSFWLNTYQGSGLVESIVSARTQLDAQAHLHLLDLIASISRFHVPVFRSEDWFFLTLYESQRNTTAYDQLHYDGSFTYGSPQQLYGGFQSSNYSAWPAPAGLQETTAILNRITDASLTLIAGVDYFLAANGSVLVFRDNPFTNPLVAKRDVFQDNTVIDRECGLWIYRGKFDIQNVYTQFGYVLDFPVNRSGERYRQMVNAVYDALVQGTTARSLEEFFAAVAGVHLARETETVRFVFTDSKAKWVITDKNAYSFSKTAQITVAVGDNLRAGDTLCDAVSFHSFHGGVTPSWLDALTVDVNILAEGYHQGLIFENQDVPLLVEEDINGRTKVSWQIQGFPGDIDKFWDDVHSNGLQRGQTLAQLLDLRPQPQSEDPGPGSLPATINPLHFLVRNLFRNNAFLIRLKTASFGPGALGLAACRLLRMIINSASLCVIAVELFHADAPVILDGPGVDGQSGYVESGHTFPVMAGHEETGPDVVNEAVRIFPVTGRCT